MTPLRALLLALLIPAALPAAADATYDAQLALARQNLATEAGAAYDRTMAEAMMGDPAVVQAVGACQQQHAPGPGQGVEGYFHFTSNTQYTVTLMPAGPFATCLGKALAGRTLPAPPSLPWFNHFTLMMPGATP